MEIRPLLADDLDWLVALTRRRRESLAPYAPRFWRPAADATDRHRAFLGQLVASPDVLTVRHDSGYLIAMPRGDHWLIDDADVTDVDSWEPDGVRLLQHARAHAQERGGDVRLVVPLFEAQRLRAGRAFGLVPVEHWWHRDLERPTQLGTVAGADRLEVEGARGRLVPAPPVYDPGGPVLLVEQVASAAALAAIEAAASRLGVPVSVVSQRPDDVRLESLLRRAGHVLTTVYLEPKSR